MSDEPNTQGNGQGGRAGSILARLTESARYLADIAGLLEKPVVTVEHNNPEAPGTARVVVALEDDYQACNDLLEFLRARYPNADITTIDADARPAEGPTEGEEEENGER